MKPIKVLELSEVDRLKLEKGYHNGPTHSFRIRCKSILLKSEGKSAPQIAEMLEVTVPTVYTWVNRYEENGIKCLETCPGQGQKPIMDCSDEEAVRKAIEDNYATFAVPYNGEDNNDYVDGKGFCCNDGSLEAAQTRALARAAKNNFQEGDTYEKMQFYYHPDHLGSSSYITNLDGEVVQHIEYVPFGEVFIEERNNIWNTPYLFNAKEFDEETGLYYYGARYYEPRLGLWISADIEQETHPNVSTYTYCLNNPILFIDPDGKGVWTKVGKAVIKVGAKVGSHGFKALTQAATYTNAFSDVLNDVNTLTDNNSSKWDKFKAGASLASELLPVSVGDIKDAYKLAKKGAKYAEREAGNLLSISKKSTKGQPKGSISGTKEALKEVKKLLKMNERETLPKNKGKFGSSMRGDSKRGYRLDPAHPSAKPGSGEEYPHINYWDYTKGKRGKGGLDGAVPIRK